MLLFTQLLALLPVSLAATYTVNHRWQSLASNGESEFIKYCTVDLPEAHDVSKIIHLDSENIKDYHRLTLQGTGAVHGLYQVQLIGEGLGNNMISSIKACHLFYGSPSLTIHQHHPRAPSSIDLIPSSAVPLNGSCPATRGDADKWEITPVLEREVTIKTPHLVFGPDLSPPIPVNPAGPDGKPAPPVEEKSFLQKYWLPLLGIAFFIISQMAPEDPKKSEAGAAKAK